MKYILYCFLILFLQCSILYDKRTGDLSIKLQGWRAENKNPVLLQIDEKLIGKLRFLFEDINGVQEKDDYPLMIFSETFPELQFSESFAVGFFTAGSWYSTFPYMWTYPSDKSIHLKSREIHLSRNGNEVPYGEYFAYISNAEIEEGGFIKNNSYLVTFGYEYDYDTYTFKEYNGECKHSSVPNIHWLGKLYNPRGLNQTVCGKLKIEKGKTVVLKIKSSPKEFHSVRTFLAWIPGAAVLAPILYGPWIESCDHTLEVQYE